VGGGYCVSDDPWFLIEKFQTETDIIHLARRIKDQMPAHVVKTIQTVLGKSEKAKITKLGLDYKGNVEDTRKSLALVVLDLIRETNPQFDLGIYDPHVKMEGMGNTNIDNTFENSDLAEVLSPHGESKPLDYSCVGRVIGVGKKVQGFQIGDRVVR